MSFLRITDLEAIPAEELRSAAQVEARAALMAHRGHARRAAAALGWKPQKVYDIIHRWRSNGALPPPPPRCPVQQRIYHRSMSFGRTYPALSRASFELRAWLAKEVPEGGTLVDFLMALAEDHVVEMEAQK